ncbi:MAG TPA: hypothetical protein VFS43_35190, partial [Polyangiaceae bacterium]|nr:hypothetical protein [Polyangiaceae bacterium]
PYTTTGTPYTTAGTPYTTAGTPYTTTAGTPYTTTGTPYTTTTGAPLTHSVGTPTTGTNFGRAEFLTAGGREAMKLVTDLQSDESFKAESMGAVREKLNRLAGLLAEYKL